MKILFISNYAAHLRVSKGVMPSHHMFGAYELVDRFVSDNSAVIKSQYGGVKLTSL